MKGLLSAHSTHYSHIKREKESEEKEMRGMEMRGMEMKGN